MPSTKSSFIEKVLGRIDVLNPENLQSFVERLARDRSFLETLFNTIEDGVLVADREGKVIYLNAAASQLTGFNEDAAMDQPVTRLLPELDWASLQAADHEGGRSVMRRSSSWIIPGNASSGFTPRRSMARPRAAPAWR